MVMSSGLQLVRSELLVPLFGRHRQRSASLQPSSISCSQQGSLKALTASLLQIAQRSLVGISSWFSELLGCQLCAAHKTIGSRIALPDEIRLGGRQIPSCCHDRRPARSTAMSSHEGDVSIAWHDAPQQERKIVLPRVPGLSKTRSPCESLRI